MGDVRHSLCRHPGSLLPIPAQRFHSLRERHSSGSIFIFSRGGGEFYCFLYQCSLKCFFFDTGDVCRRHCRRPLLLVAHSEATRVLTTPNAVPHTRDLQKNVQWGCFVCGNTTHRKKNRREKIRDACHGLCRRPWQSVARSSVTSVLAISEFF